MVSLQSLGFGLLGASPGIDDAEIANPGWADAARQRMDDAHRQGSDHVCQRSDHGRARNDRTCHQAKPLPGPDERYLLDDKAKPVTLAAAAGGTRENDNES
jgi:hypothetical protein